ncbi:hypothetical protein CGCF413_v003125 [Colletotrichum fructicola]|nr:hypothetical protein CGCF413_v003125 [Colletotrichum fructicola]
MTKSSASSSTVLVGVVREGFLGLDLMTTAKFEFCAGCAGDVFFAAAGVLAACLVGAEGRHLGNLESTDFGSNELGGNSGELRVAEDERRPGEGR